MEIHGVVHSPPAPKQRQLKNGAVTALQGAEMRVGDDFLAKRQPQRQVSPILANLKAKTATKCVTKQNYMNHMKEINETQ